MSRRKRGGRRSFLTVIADAIGEFLEGLFGGWH